MEQSKKIVLVDGTSYIFRAFHAIKVPMKTSTGLSTSTSYGMTNMLNKLKEGHPNTPIVVAFDAKGKTFRDEIYSEYKSNRPPTPQEIREQTPYVKAITKAMGFPVIEMTGVEADDVLGTLSKIFESMGYYVIVSTGDKDLCQLVTENIVLSNSMTNETLDVEGVKKKFGVAPDLIRDYLAISGDSIDNIPGVAGVGDKTASKLLSQVGPIEAILEASLEDFTNAGIRGAKRMYDLIQNSDTLAISRELTTIKTDLDIPIDFDVAPPVMDREALVSLYTELEFRKMLTDMGAGLSTLNERNQQDDDFIDSTSILRDSRKSVEFIYDLQDLNTIGLKLFNAKETTTVIFNSAKVGDGKPDALVSMSIFNPDTMSSYYIPMAHDYDCIEYDWSTEEVLENFSLWLESSDCKKCMYNAKSAYSLLERNGVTLDGVVSDVMLTSYISGKKGSQKKATIESLALRLLNVELESYEKIAGKGAKQLPFNKVTVDNAMLYSNDQVVALHLLNDLLNQDLNGIDEEILRDVEIPFSKVLSKMEMNGVKIDRDILEDHSKYLENKIIVAEKAAESFTDIKFSLSSPKQVGDTLYNKLGLTPPKTKKGAAPTTKDEYLTTIAHEHPVVGVIQDHRKLKKIKSTYTDSLLRYADSNDRVHTTYNQALVSSGRLSSEEPNLQTLPAFNESSVALSNRIRESIIGESFSKIVSLDYSQIELYIIAQLSGERALIDAINNGEDLHSRTASEVFGVNLDEVTPDLRRRAKAINFGLIYGKTSVGLAEELGITRYQGQAYIDQYFRVLPKVVEFLDRVKESAETEGYVKTFYGRKIFTPDAQSSNGMVRKAGLRTAINAPMQGTSADIIKRAMIGIQKWIDNNPMHDVKMIMQVHDELVFEIRSESHETINNYIGQIKHFMLDAASFDFPLKVDVGIGNNFAEAH